MKRIGYLAVLSASIAVLSSTQGTTVIPPTFDELVAQAEVIFEGNVTNVASQWVGEGAQRHIVSYVSFKVEDALKGSPGETYTIRMFGGTVEDETMEVADAPKFKVGDKEILFVENNGSQVIPIVGMMHGRFHVRRDHGQEVVTTSEGEPVKNVARLGREAADSSIDTILTPADFKAAVKSKLQVAQ